MGQWPGGWGTTVLEVLWFYILFYIWFYILRFVIHFGLIFVKAVRYRIIIFFFCMWSFCSSTICLKDYSFSIELPLCLFQKSVDYLCGSVLEFYCVSLMYHWYMCVYSFANTMLFWLLQCYRSFKIGKCESSGFIFLSIALAVRGLLPFYVKDFLVNIYKSACWNFYRDWIKSIYQVRKKWHLNSIEFSNP